MNILTSGSKGADVLTLQRDLKFLNYNITIDGIFGKGTELVVQKFQSEQGLEVDGKVGPKTWEILDFLVPQGMDISHLNGQVDWNNLSERIQFVYCKASQGATFKDPIFTENIKNLQEKQIFKGAYHFLTFQDTAQSQIDNFLSINFDFTSPGTLPPVVDVEWQVGSNPEETNTLNQYISDNQTACIELVIDFMKQITDKTDRSPIIYTARSFMQEYLKNTDLFSEYPLWIPSYQQELPGLPPGWNNFKFWQYSDNATVDGGSSGIDLDLFNGNADDLKTLCS